MWHHICFSQTGCNSWERSLALIPIFIHMWPFSWKSHELFGPKKPSVKLHSACFEKLIFKHVSNVRRTERVAKFDGFIGPWHCETIKGNCGTHNRPEKFQDFWETVPWVEKFKDEREWTGPALLTFWSVNFKEYNIMPYNMAPRIYYFKMKCCRTTLLGPCIKLFWNNYLTI